MRAVHVSRMGGECLWISIELIFNDVEVSRCAFEIIYERVVKNGPARAVYEINVF